MRRRAGRSVGAAVAALAAGLALAPPAVAQADGAEPAVPAPVETAYRGRKIVVNFSGRTPQVTTMTVVFQPGGRERREFHGNHALIVVDGATSWQYLPGQGVVVKRPRRDEGAGDHLRPAEVRRSRASYEIRVTPSAPVAGRRTLEMEFTPRQRGSRPMRRVWVDAATGLILRTEVYGADSRLAWLAVFENLDYHPALDPAAFTLRVPAGVRVVEAAADPCLEPAEAARVAGVPAVMPAYLPAGFERQCVRARRSGGDGEMQVVFGDGLSLLSLFASTSFRDPGGAGEAVAVGAGSARWHALGLVNALSWRVAGAHLALLGELSREELSRVAASVAAPGDPGELSAPARRP